MNTLLDRPVADPKLLLREAVAQDLLRGRSEDFIYMHTIDQAIESARLVGLDESDVEVVAAGVRRDVAEALAALRAEGLHAEHD